MTCCTAFAVHAFADGQVDPPRCAHASKASDGILRKGWSTGRPLTGANLSGHYPTCVAECAADARCVGITAVVPGGNFSGAGQCELLNSVTQTNTDYRWLSWNKSGERSPRVLSYHYLPPSIPSAKLLRCCYCTSKCHLLTVCTVLYSAMSSCMQPAVSARAATLQPPPRTLAAKAQR